MIFICFFVLFLTRSFCADVCYKDECLEDSFRYLLYDVNPPEGFNLRRDVYMRMAVLSHKLSKSKDPDLKTFHLVLPPWSHLMHWSYSEEPEQIPWGNFFNLTSLRAFAPVMEMHEFLGKLKRNKYTKVILDKVYILQHYEEMFQTGKFVDKWEIRKCEKPPKLRYFYYNNITSTSVQCVSFHGPVTKLSGLLKQTSANTILIEHAEIALHDMFGNKLYWEARRSMRFNNKLREIASEFRREFLNSTDESDNTHLHDDWRSDVPHRSANGGPYIAIHMRRRDFVRSRSNEIPDLDDVAMQISHKLDELRLQKIFIATDATKHEYSFLKSKIEPTYKVYRFQASNTVEKEVTEGGVAIIDQIICSYARHFIGTSESTFSFRIQEEREILGFPIETTFNSLCKSGKKCQKPSVWQIVF